MAENVKIAILKISGPRGSPRKTFAEPRLPEKVLTPVKRAGAAVCTNSVCTKYFRKSLDRATYHKSLDGVCERRKRVGHMRGVP